MTTVHAQRSVFHGDEWQIRGRLYDRDRSPLDIDGVTIEWAMMDSAGVEVVGPDDVTIAPLVEADGTFLITVPTTKTSTIAAGHYTDSLRISGAGFPRETLWYGPIIVKPSVFEDD
jgi:hypothetical protein